MKANQEVRDRLTDEHARWENERVALLLSSEADDRMKLTAAVQLVGSMRRDPALMGHRGEDIGEKLAFVLDCYGMTICGKGDQA